ncbi:MAG TPA: PQQ-dependent sugar dehydrogenase [Nitrososphaeraceae archaeon]|nr:PQQ-dependent sugar dehydrogenase [Nitrososphaeraceae archaeon]
MLVSTAIIFSSLTLNMNYTAIAQQQEQPIINDPNLQVEIFVEGLSFPTSMAFIDKNNILVLEKEEGTVRLVSNGLLQEQPVLKVDVNSDSERGLLGIAIKNKDTVFLYYTESSSSSEDIEPLKNRVYKYQWNEEEKILVNPKLILDLPAIPGPNHDGGKLAIGPDKYLYAVIGDLNHDGKLQNIVDGPKPDDTGVIFRINPENGSSAPDNPFASTENNRYYAYGIRNSFGIDFDPVSGKLWDTENGPQYGDEINVVEPGFNSGWKQVMGPISKSNVIEDELVNFPGSKYADPVFSWFPSTGITDIEFLNSSKLGEKYANNIFVGDIGAETDGYLYSFQVNDDRTGITFDGNSQIGLTDLIADNEEEMSAIALGTAFGGITDIETGPDGFLYLLTVDRESDGEGKIYRISLSQ